MEKPMDILARPQWSETFMGIVEVLVKRSLCIKYQTACLIVKGSQIIAMGYNGTFSGHEECCEYWKKYFVENVHEEYKDYTEWINTDHFKNLHRTWSLENEVHAEVNALNWISKKDIDDSCVLYTLYSPCDKCATQIISYGIKNVYYKYKYPSGEKAIQRLLNNGVICTQV